jgi:3-deoxy-D-manno-octulosonic-acid transferase
VNSLVTILYEVSLWVVGLVTLPKMLYKFFIHKKYHQSLPFRLGFKSPKFSKKREKKRIWIHAVSVGETKAIVSLARELKQRFPTSELIISSVTESGHGEAKRSLPFADYHVYLPLDFNGLVSRMVKQASPDLVILCESDFWYHFLRHAKKQGAIVALVNGKLSKRSTYRFGQLPFFSKRLFSLFHILCVQNVLYKERYLQAGALEENIQVTGNLKFDEDYPWLGSEEITHWKHKLGIEQDQLVMTIGSTHDPEEMLILNVLKDLWKSFPNLKVLIVPRHPDRFKEVSELIHKKNISHIHFTDISQRTGQEQVLLVNVIGMLRMCYQLSDIAVVGGSFTNKVGGHNILEPCWYGKPVLFGPHMYTQLELVDLVTRYQAGRQVQPTELLAVLESWLRSPSLRQEMGQKGLKMISEIKGSTQRTLAALSPSLSRL